MPSSMVRRGIWTVGIAILLLVAVVAAVPFVASNRIVADRIALELGALTGYRVDIGAAPEIAVWPSFRAILTDVTLSDRTSDETVPVIEADRIELDLSAMAALGGVVQFSTARLIRPTLYVEPRANSLPLPSSISGGRLSRSVAQVRRGLQQPNDAPALPDDPLGRVEFSGGEIVMLRDGQPVPLVTGIAGTLNWPELDEPALLSVTGIWRGENVAVELRSAQPLLALAGGESPLTVALRSAPATASFEGKARLAAGGYLDGRVRFESPSLHHLMDWARAGVSAGGTVGAVSVASRVLATEQRAKFENTEVTIDGNAGVGALELTLTEAVPGLTGTVAFQKMDLDVSLASLAPGAGGGEREAGFAASLPGMLDVDLRLSAARATAGSIPLSDVAANVQLRNGLAVFDISDAGAFGGSLQTSLRVDQKADASTLEFRLLATDIDGGAFATAAGMKRLVPVGRGTVSLILKGPGRSWRSMLERADGSFSASFGSGSISGFDFAGFLKRAKQRGFFSFDEVSSGTLPIEGADVKARIAKGVAHIDKAEVRTQRHRIAVSGIVPYVGGGLALSGGVLPREPAATQQATDDVAAFFVGGSWLAPFFWPVASNTILE